MKKTIGLILLLSICMTGYSLAQSDSKNKYSIQLPEEWKGKPKFLYKLAEIIRRHIPQLENKKECVDCDAQYSVKFYISEPIVDYTFYLPASSYEFVTMCRFSAFMEVSDSMGKTFHRLILNDTSSVYSFNYKLQGRGVNFQPVQNTISVIKENLLPPLQNNQRNISVNLDDRTFSLNKLSQQFDSNQFIKNNSKILTPTEMHLWNTLRNIILDFKIEESQ